jgi:hypothetical protein
MTTATDHNDLMEVLPCPFCGELPKIVPSNPEADGDAWGAVCCMNNNCFAMPAVDDGTTISDARGSVAYKNLAIERWNRRSSHAAAQDGWQLSDAKCHHDNGKHVDPPCVFVYFTQGCNCSQAEHQWLCQQHYDSARNCEHEVLIDLRPSASIPTSTLDRWPDETEGQHITRLLRAIAIKK